MTIIELYPQDITNLMKNTNNIINIDTDGIKPLAHVLNLENVVREDEVKEGLTIEEALHKQLLFLFLVFTLSPYTVSL